MDNERHFRIKKKNMFKSHFLNGNESNKTCFKKYSNKLTKIKAMSKQLYYLTKLQQSQNEPRGMWKIICSASCLDHSINNNTTLNIHGKKNADSRLIANRFKWIFFVILGQVWPNNFVKMNLIYLKDFFIIISLRLFI